MSDRQSTDTVRAAVAALNRGDVDGYVGRFDPSCERWIAGFDQPLSLEDVADGLHQLQAAFDQLRLDEEALFGDDHLVCARWVLIGTHAADYMGVAASGRAIAWPSCEVYEVHGGVVRTVWTYQDTTELFRQIGAA